jgi:hypothetical protein
MAFDYIIIKLVGYGKIMFHRWLHLINFWGVCKAYLCVCIGVLQNVQAANRD